MTERYKLTGTTYASSGRGGGGGGGESHTAVQHEGGAPGDAGDGGATYLSRAAQRLIAQGDDPRVRAVEAGAARGAGEISSPRPVFTYRPYLDTGG